MAQQPNITIENDLDAEMEDAGEEDVKEEPGINIKEDSSEVCHLSAPLRLLSSVWCLEMHTAIWCLLRECDAYMIF